MGCGFDFTSPQLIRMLLPGGTVQCNIRSFTEVSTVMLAKTNLAGIEARAAAPSHATH